MLTPKYNKGVGFLYSNYRALVGLSSAMGKVTPFLFVFTATNNSLTKNNFNMNQKTIEVGVDVTKKKYVAPEIEVVDLAEQPKLLSASAISRKFTGGFADDGEESW